MIVLYQGFEVVVVRALLLPCSPFSVAVGRESEREREKACVEVRRAAKARLPPAGEAELLAS